VPQPATGSPASQLPFVLWCRHILFRQYRAVPPFSSPHPTSVSITAESVTSPAVPLSIRHTPLQEFSILRIFHSWCLFISRRRPTDLCSSSKCRAFRGPYLAIVIAPSHYCFTSPRFASPTLQLPGRDPEGHKSRWPTNQSARAANILHLMIQTEATIHRLQGMEILEMTKIHILHQKIQTAQATTSRALQLPVRRVMIGCLTHHQIHLASLHTHMIREQDSISLHHISGTANILRLSTQSVLPNLAQSVELANLHQDPNHPSYQYPPAARSDGQHYQPPPDAYRLPPPFPGPGYPYPPPHHYAAPQAPAPRQRTAIACKYCRKRKVSTKNSDIGSL
jgi:hypothetical protein